MPQRRLTIPISPCSLQPHFAIELHLWCRDGCCLATPSVAHRHFYGSSEVHIADGNGYHPLQDRFPSLRRSYHWAMVHYWRPWGGKCEHEIFLLSDCALPTHPIQATLDRAAQQWASFPFVFRDSIPHTKFRLNSGISSLRKGAQQLSNYYVYDQAITYLMACTSRRKCISVVRF